MSKKYWIGTDRFKEKIRFYINGLELEYLLPQIHNKDKINTNKLSVQYYVEGKGEEKYDVRYLSEDDVKHIEYFDELIAHIYTLDDFWIYDLDIDIGTLNLDIYDQMEVSYSVLPEHTNDLIAIINKIFKIDSSAPEEDIGKIISYSMNNIDVTIIANDKLEILKTFDNADDFWEAYQSGDEVFKSD